MDEKGIKQVLQAATTGLNGQREGALLSTTCQVMNIARERGVMGVSEHHLPAERHSSFSILPIPPLILI